MPQRYELAADYNKINLLRQLKSPTFYYLSGRFPLRLRKVGMPFKLPLNQLNSTFQRKTLVSMWIRDGVKIQNLYTRAELNGWQQKAHSPKNLTFGFL